MFYKVMADTVVVIHLLWILFLIFGAFAGVRKRAVAVVHIGALCFALFINIFGLLCPLTTVELWARQSSDPTLAYTGSFIIHYMEELIYLDLSRSALTVLTLALCVFNLVYYRKNWGRWRKDRGGDKGDSPFD